MRQPHPGINLMEDTLQQTTYNCSQLNYPYLLRMASALHEVISICNSCNSIWMRLHTDKALFIFFLIYIYIFEISFSYFSLLFTSRINCQIFVQNVAIPTSIHTGQSRKEDAESIQIHSSVLQEFEIML